MGKCLFFFYKNQLKTSIRLDLELPLTHVTHRVFKIGYQKILLKLLQIKSCLHCVCWGVHEFWGYSEESFQKWIKILECPSDGTLNGAPCQG